MLRSPIFARGVAVMALAAFIFTSPGGAQTPTGTLQGTVGDQSGAAVAGGRVTITNNATNEVKDLTTDGSGHYVLPFLTPGTYSVTVEAKGFRTAREENIKIDVSQNRSIDFTLIVGQVSDSIEVQATATPLDTNTATLGQVIDTKKVLDLP